MSSGRYGGQPPILVYRLQLNEDFTFKDAVSAIPYFLKLGVTHLYISPILEAKPGSSHFYDVVDFRKVSSALGGINGFRNFSKKAAASGIRVILDIVPNHMSYSAYNPFIRNFNLKGNRGISKDLFDLIPSPYLGNKKILFPFLPKPLDVLIEDGDFEVDERGDNILLCGVPLPVATGFIRSLRSKAKGSVSTRESIISLLPRINLRPSLFAHASVHINYRRFFAVNEMIAVRVDDPNVFRRTHAVIRSLARQNLIWGVRVDHLDGLRYPSRYVSMLRDYVPVRYVVCEKIMTPDESFDAGWDGSTGYGFLGHSSAVLSYGPGAMKISTFYKERIDAEKPNLTLRRFKKEFLIKSFGGEVENIASMIYNCLSVSGLPDEIFSAYVNSVIAILSSFDNYRTYSTEEDVSDFLEAMHRLQVSHTEDRVLKFFIGHLEANCLLCRRTAVTIQQFTGAVAAKSLEDRLFFHYVPLIGLNEVGWQPWICSIEVKRFVNFLNRRNSYGKYSFNETSTHDTKFGEDFRCILISLSELASEYIRAAKFCLSLKLKREFSSLDRRHALYIMQLALFPELSASGKERLEGQLIKAIRESQLHSRWLEVDVNYEACAIAFLHRLLKYALSPKHPLYYLRQTTSLLGRLNSGTLQILKFFSPGVTAIYQGSEMGNFTLTDPDNRRRVSFSISQLPSSSDEAVNALYLLKRDQQWKIKLILRLVQIRRECIDILHDGNSEAVSVRGSRSECIIAYSVHGKHGTIIVLAARYFSRLLTQKGDTLEWGDTCILPKKRICGSYVEAFSGRELQITGRTPLAEIMQRHPFLIFIRQVRE
ncbi:MAG: malto-oligosyltrehalose synthase [Methanomassiliicoccales archaeon]